MSCRDVTDVTWVVSSSRVWHHISWPRGGGLQQLPDLAVAGWGRAIQYFYRSPHFGQVVHRDGVALRQHGRIHQRGSVGDQEEETNYTE